MGISRTYPKQAYEFDYQLVDITQESAINTFAKAYEASHGSLFALINCAGMGISGAIEHTTLNEARKIFDINVFGSFMMSKAFIPLLRSSKPSKIINISSVASDLAIPFQTFYSMTKASINAFTKALALELKPFDIGVCAVLPGDTTTGFTKNREKSAILEDENYGNRIRRSVERMEKDEQNGKNPMTVALVVARLLKRNHVPAMKAVGFQYQLFLVLNKFLPRQWVQSILYKLYGN